jgi:GAF domain-containing protein
MSEHLSANSSEPLSFEHHPATVLPTTPTISTSIDPKQALAGVVARIRESLDLDTIFTTTAQEVRQLLNVDRVGIFRFYPDLDWQGEVIAEAVNPEWVAALHTPVQDHCFSERFAEFYRQGRINAIDDIYAQSYNPCYLAVLQQFQIRANVVAPLLIGQNLWGLLCIHQCARARTWNPTEIEFIQQISTHLSVALQHGELLSQMRQQLEQQRTMATVVARIRQSLDLAETFQTTATQVRELLNVDRVGVFRFDPKSDWLGELVAEDVQSPWRSALGDQVIDHCFSERFATAYQNGRVNAIADIYQESYQDCYIQVLEHFQVRANVVAPLICAGKLWGLLCIHQCSSSRQWQPHEIEFAYQIADHLGVAITQASQVEQMQSQLQALMQAEERERLAKQQQAIATTVDKIRRSLDLATIFQTTTQEVRQLLQTDRVSIYRFNPDWSGQFIVESVAEGWNSLLAAQIEHPEIRENVSNCSVQQLGITTDTHIQATQGELFNPENAYRICPDVEAAGFSACYLAALHSYEVRAYAIVGIYHENKLWGLLAAFQNEGPRDWRSDEVTLLTRISSQLGVALQQAESVQRIQAQATQLAKAAERQQALAKTINRIRQSLDLEAIFHATTQEVRLLLEVDRVAIYRFYPDWSGEFVADSIAHGFNPTHLSHDMPTLTSILQPKLQTGQYPRNESFVPILEGERLWGLLVAYQNGQPRYWQEEEINLLAQVGVQLGIAIQQAELLKQTRKQAEELTQAIQSLQESQTQLIQGEKMASLGQLVAGIAHEINNPISFILGNVTHLSNYVYDLLALISCYQQEYPQPTEFINAEMQRVDFEFLQSDMFGVLKSMANGAERIRQIVLSLRTFSRLDEAQMKPVKLHEGLDSTLMILEHRLHGNHLRPSIKITKDYGQLPEIECYAAQLHQVFLNLLSNAIDAIEIAIQQGLRSNSEADNNPEITIKTQLEDAQWVTIVITDNGVGIAPELHDRIFDPFFTTKAVGQGIGLGLSTSYQIITNRHQGELKVTSQEDIGSTFVIRIPVKQSHGATIA